MTSPEIFIFLFFMITDPKTVPSGRVARVVFGFSIGVVASLLMAPWDTEFGVKVGLLSGLVVMCAVRPFAERFFPVAGSDDDRLGVWLGGLLAAPSPDGSGRRHAFARIAVASVGMLAFGGGVAAAGLPNTEPASNAAASVLTQPTTAGSLSDIDPASLPTVTIDRRVRALSASLADQAGAQELAATLLWNLRVEAEAVVTGDASLLPAVTDGQRLQDITDQITTAGPDGPRVASAFTFDGLHLQIVYPGGLQRGANAGLVATGTVVETTYAPDGTRHVEHRAPVRDDVLDAPDHERALADHGHPRPRRVAACGAANRSYTISASTARRTPPRT